MQEYLLLFRGGSADRIKMSPEEMQADMLAWQKWIGGIAESGKLLGAQPLKPEGKVITGTAKKLTDGPFMEAKEILGGFAHVKVANAEEALAMSNNCPILKFESGTVEIREIGTMSI